MMVASSKKVKKASDLEELDVLEVSLVKRGANKKQFALWKNEEGKPMRDLTAAILAAPGEEHPELVKEMVTKGLSAEARSTVSDAVKLLSAVKEEMSANLYKQVQRALGVKGLEDEEKPKEAEEDEAPPAAENDEEEVPAEKAEGDDSEEVEEEKAEDELEEAKKLDPSSQEDADLAKVAKAGDDRLEALFKKNQELESVIKAHESEKREKEYITKAEAEFGAVPGANAQEIGSLLKDLADLAPGLTGKVEGILKAANSFVQNSGLLAEVGSAQTGASNPFVKNSDFDAKIEGMARQRVAKTGESFAKAYEGVLSENPDLYNESIGWKE